MPPDQFNIRLVPSRKALTTIGGAATTDRFMVAELERPPGSVTLTTVRVPPKTATREIGIPATVIHGVPIIFCHVVKGGAAAGNIVVKRVKIPAAHGHHQWR